MRGLRSGELLEPIARQRMQLLLFERARGSRRIRFPLAQQAVQSRTPVGERGGRLRKQKWHTVEFRKLDVAVLGSATSDPSTATFRNADTRAGLRRSSLLRWSSDGPGRSSMTAILQTVSRQDTAVRPAPPIRRSDRAVYDRLERRQRIEQSGRQSRSREQRREVALFAVQRHVVQHRRIRQQIHVVGGGRRRRLNRTVRDACSRSAGVAPDPLRSHRSTARVRSGCRRGTTSRPSAGCRWSIRLCRGRRPRRR